MIVKIATESGWKYSDNVKDFYVENVTVQKCNEENKAYSYTNLVNHETKKALADGIDGAFQRTVKAKSAMTRGNVQLKELFLGGRDNGSEIWLIDTEVFLMNDEGKTIERIY